MDRPPLPQPVAGAQRAVGAADDPSGGSLPGRGGLSREIDANEALRVLVVEDLPRVQQLLRELIDEPGRFEVAGLAESEEEAIAKFDLLLPQAVVVDLNLKSGTGLGVIAGLRRKHTSPPPLLIVLTNHALPVLEAACLKAGADYFLDKSRDFHKVRTLLEHAASRHSVLPGDGTMPPHDGNSTRH